MGGPISPNTRPVVGAHVSHYDIALSDARYYIRVSCYNVLESVNDERNNLQENLQVLQKSVKTSNGVGQKLEPVKIYMRRI